MRQEVTIPSDMATACGGRLDRCYSDREGADKMAQWEDLKTDGERIRRLSESS